MPYHLATFLHVGAALAFVAIHGTSMAVLYMIRGEKDRARIETLCTISGKTVMPMYMSLLAIILTGIWAGVVYVAWGKLWLWLAIGVLLVEIALMSAMARPYLSKVKAACEVRPTGVPRVSDEELSLIVRSGTAHAITAVGVVGLAAILYLMVFKPWS